MVIATPGAKIATAASIPPRQPATWNPTDAAVIRIGPGVVCPNATPAPNAWGLSQWWPATTSCWSTGRIVYPLPKAAAPILAMSAVSMASVPDARAAATAPAATTAAGTSDRPSPRPEIRAAATAPGSSGGLSHAPQRERAAASAPSTPQRVHPGDTRREGPTASTASTFPRACRAAKSRATLATTPTTIASSPVTRSLTPLTARNSA